MKILTFKRFIGLAAIGGVAYVHKQRGGQWTVASITDTLRHLWSSAVGKLAPVKDAARDTLDRAAGVTQPAARTDGVSDERTSRTYSDYNRHKDDTSRH